MNGWSDGWMDGDGEVNGRKEEMEGSKEKMDGWTYGQIDE